MLPNSGDPATEGVSPVRTLGRLEAGIWVSSSLPFPLPRVGIAHHAPGVGTWVDARMPVELVLRHVHFAEVHARRGEGVTRKAGSVRAFGSGIHLVEQGCCSGTTR